MKRYIKWFAITIFISMLSACVRTAPVQQISTTVGKIHKNYNRWVRNLDKDIQVNLSTGATL